MLQALQAAMVYGILCSQCTELVSKDDSAWVVATIEVSLLRSVPWWSHCHGITNVTLFDPEVCRGDIRSAHVGLGGRSLMLVTP